MPNADLVRVASSPYKSQFVDFVFTPDGESLLSTSGVAVAARSVPGLEETRRFKPGIFASLNEGGRSAFFDGGRQIFFLKSDLESEEGRHRLIVVDMETQAIRHEADFQVAHYGVTQLLLNRAENELLLTDAEGITHFLDFPTCTRTRSATFSAEGVEKCCSVEARLIYSPDETEIWAVCRGNGTPEARMGPQRLAAFDKQTGKLLRQRRPDAGEYFAALQLSPDGKLLAVVEDRAIRLLCPQTWKTLRSIEVPITSDDFNSEVAVNDEGEVVLKRKDDEILNSGWGTGPTAVAFSADLGLLALGCEMNQRLCLIDLEKGTHLGNFVGDEKWLAINSLRFSPDGRYLAIHNLGQDIEIWDVAKMLPT